MTARSAGAAFATGGLSGAGATIVMSVVMLGARRAGLIADSPPERITAAALDTVGVRERSTPTQDALTMLFHLGFGVSAGAIFGLLYRLARLPIPPIAQGMIYGSLVWFVSYGGWVPALGIMPPPTRDEPGRPVVMIIEHWIYGGVLGAIVGRLT